MIYLIEINLNLHICTFNCRQDIRHRYLVISPALLELIKSNLIHRLFRASSLFALDSFSALSALSMIFWIFLVVLLPGTWLSVLSKFRMSRQAVPDPGLLISSALKTTKTPQPLRGFVWWLYCGLSQTLCLSSSVWKRKQHFSSLTCLKFVRCHIRQIIFLTDDHTTTYFNVFF